MTSGASGFSMALMRLPAPLSWPTQAQTVSGSSETGLSERDLDCRNGGGDVWGAGSADVVFPSWPGEPKRLHPSLCTLALCAHEPALEGIGIGLSGAGKGSGQPRLERGIGRAALAVLAMRGQPCRPARRSCPRSSAVYDTLRRGRTPRCGTPCRAKRPECAAALGASVRVAREDGLARGPAEHCCWWRRHGLSGGVWRWLPNSARASQLRAARPGTTGLGVSPSRRRLGRRPLLPLGCPRPRTARRRGHGAAPAHVLTPG